MHLQPMMRAALLAAYNTPTRSLRRGPGGYIAISGTIRTSGPVQYQAYTRRTVNRLDEAGLVMFDDPRFPTTVVLNARGMAEAEQLLAADRAKAGVA